jgi:hypothetical protein
MVIDFLLLGLELLVCRFSLQKWVFFLVLGWQRSLGVVGDLRGCDLSGISSSFHGFLTHLDHRKGTF